VNRCNYFILSLLILGGALKLSAQGTAFNYQGQLNAAGAPATGSYDLRFALYDAVTNGNRASILLTNSAVPVTNGLFSTTLDFGAIFAGTNYWLDIAVRSAAETNFTTLMPRQPVLPVPYAIFAATASNVSGTVSAAQLTGTVPSAQIAGTYSGPVNFNNAGNAFTGTFTGGGAALTSLNASQLTSGTVADARLTPNVALLDHDQTFTGINIFTNRGNSFIGSFFGNGNVGWIPVSGTSTQAMPNAGYILLNAGLTTVTLPSTASLLSGDVVRISGAGSGGWRIGQATNQSIFGNFVSYRSSAWVQATADNGTWRCLASSANGSLMYAGADSLAGIYASTDFGHTWGSTPATGSGWRGVACSADGTKIFAVPNSGDIQFSLDSGATWSGVSGSSMAWSSVACSADGSQILAAVRGGRLFLSTNSGAVWNFTGPTGNASWTAVAVSADGTHMAAAINGGSIYTTVNSGGTWTANAPSALWTAVKNSADGTKLAATIFNNSIYTSTNAGAAWVLTGAPTNSWSCLSASSDCTRLVAGVSNSILYASVNLGASWSPLAGTASQPWSAITGSSDGGQLAAAVNKTTGNIYYSGSSTQTITLTGTNGVLSGSQGSAVELLYIGNGQFMPVSSSGILWAN